jgi:hypothetical protein
MKALTISGHDLGHAVDRVHDLLDGLVQGPLRRGPTQHVDTLLALATGLLEERHFLSPDEHPAPRHRSSTDPVTGSRTYSEHGEGRNPVLQSAVVPARWLLAGPTVMMTPL